MLLNGHPDLSDVLLARVGSAHYLKGPRVKGCRAHKVGDGSWQVPIRVCPSADAALHRPRPV